jgi:hypothetical protein
MSILLELREARQWERKERKIDKSTKVQLRSELMHMDTVFIFPTLSKYVPSLSLSLSRWFINYLFIL